MNEWKLHTIFEFSFLYPEICFQSWCTSHRIGFWKIIYVILTAHSSMFATNVKKNFETKEKLSSMLLRGEWKHACTTHLTIVWLFNDIWCYLFIACFEWKIGVFQQTVVVVYFILKQTSRTFKIVHFLSSYLSISRFYRSSHWRCSARKGVLR